MTSFVQAIEGVYGKDWSISSKMGWRIHPVHNTRKHHNGTDIVAKKRGPVEVRAIANGRVVKARKSNAPGGGFGYYVVIRHYIDGKFFSTLYAHLEKDSFKVEVGQLVKAGDAIAIMGSTGMSTGRHLHLELWKGAKHGWTPDGRGFIEPVKWVKTMNAAAEAKAAAKASQEEAKKSTPETEKTESKPVHEFKRPTKGDAAASPNSPVNSKRKPAPKPTAKKAPFKANAKDGDKDGLVQDGTIHERLAKKKEQPKPKFYTVKRGDNLTKIAKEHNTTVPALKKLNNLANANLIVVGQKLQLPS